MSIHQQIGGLSGQSNLQTIYKSLCSIISVNDFVMYQNTKDLWFGGTVSTIMLITQNLHKIRPSTYNML